MLFAFRNGVGHFKEAKDENIALLLEDNSFVGAKSASILRDRKMYWRQWVKL